MPSLKENTIPNKNKEMELYKKLSEEEIFRLKNLNESLQYKLSITSNLLDISKYLNIGIGSDNIFNIINDVAIAIFGVKYSTIIVKEGNNTYLNVSNVNSKNYKNFNFLYKFFGEETFSISCRDELDIISIKEPDTHSLLGYPIFCRKKFVGYMILEHPYANFFDHHKIHFLSALADLLAVTYENYTLYKQLDQKSKHDPVLNILTRTEFMNRLNFILKKKNSPDFGIIMIDVDNFKSINDSHGHIFGDSALNQTVNAIKELLDKNDMIARYGGDEFILYINSFKDIKELLIKAEKIRKSIEVNTIKLNGSKSSLTISLGVSVYPYDGRTLDELLNNADNMLYKSKDSGKNKVEINPSNFS